MADAERIEVPLLPEEVLALIKYIEPALHRMNLKPDSKLVTAHAALDAALLAWEERPR